MAPLLSPSGAWPLPCMEDSPRIPVGLSEVEAPPAPRASLSAARYPSTTLRANGKEKGLIPLLRPVPYQGTPYNPFGLSAVEAAPAQGFAAC